METTAATHIEYLIEDRPPSVGLDFHPFRPHTISYADWSVAIDDFDRVREALVRQQAEQKRMRRAHTFTVTVRDLSDRLVGSYTTVTRRMDDVGDWVETTVTHEAGRWPEITVTAGAYLG